MDILSQNMTILHNMANLLLEKETIYSEEVDQIMAGADYKHVAKELEKREKTRKRKEAKKRKAAEIEKAKQLQELKIKAAEALSSAGVITKQELDVIKQETQKMEQAAQTQSSKKAKPKRSSDKSVEAAEKPKAKPRTNSGAGKTTKSTKSNNSNDKNEQ